MVGGFLRAFKSETKRILQSQRSDLNLSELEKMIPSHLAKEEEDAKKSASEQRKKKKKIAKEKPQTESPTVPSLPPEGSSAEAIVEINTVVLDDLVSGADVIAPEFGTDV